MRRRLPPLNALAAFENVAEYGSLTAAAMARGVSQPSISRHITLLENWMGVKLLNRKANNISLSADGVELGRVVRDAFDQIELTVRQLQERQATPIVLGCSGAIAHLWVYPMLSSLHHSNPFADLNIFSSENYNDFDRSGMDLSIRFGNVDKFPRHAALLISECVFPVASPAFAKRHQLTADSVPENFDSSWLLHHTRGTYGWLNWPKYFATRDVEHSSQAISQSVNNYPLLIDRAVESEGVILGHSGPINQSIQSGKLVQVGPATGRTGYGFYLLNALRPSAKSAVNEVRDWLLTQGAKISDTSKNQELN